MQVLLVQLENDQHTQTRGVSVTGCIAALHPVKQYGTTNAEVVWPGHIQQAGGPAPAVSLSRRAPYHGLAPNEGSWRASWRACVGPADLTVNHAGYAPCPPTACLAVIHVHKSSKCCCVQLDSADLRAHVNNMSMAYISMTTMACRTGSPQASSLDGLRSFCVCGVYHRYCRPATVRVLGVTVLAARGRCEVCI